MAISSFSDKKKKLSKRRESNAFSRHELKTVSVLKKDSILKKLKVVLNVGARIGKHIIVGFNCVQKSMEKGIASVVCFCRDCHAEFQDAIIESAKARGIPIVVLPSGESQVAKVFSLKRVSCFSIPTQSQLNLCPNHSLSSSEEDQLLSTIDGFREELQSTT